jgi:hypothetical protein
MAAPEHSLQSVIIDNLNFHLRGLKATIETDVMSGLQFLPRNTASRFRFVSHHKAMGYVTGQPDLVLLLANGETLLVEIKNGKKGVQSPEQKAFQEMATRLGHNYVIWRSLDDALEFIEGYKKVLRNEMD